MIYYITGNKNKLASANKYCAQLGINFEAKELELVEIQSHSIEEIAKSKAEQAYKQIKEPVLVNDHGWSFAGLNGFPGAYMKYMNEWFEPEDFFNLTKGLENREVTLTEVLCFQDNTGQKLFKGIHKGVVLDAMQGRGLPAMTVVSLTNDGISVAEKMKAGIPSFDEFPIWESFAQWYNARK